MRAFTDVLRDLNEGKFADECTEALQEVVSSAMSTGKGGALSITLKIKPGKGGNVMQIEHGINVKSPEFERPTDYMFATTNGDLVRESPNQPRLPFREVVDSATGEIKQVAAAS